MGTFIIRNPETGKFVAVSGSAGSYTDKLQHARVFNTLEEAKRNTCGNEYVTTIDKAVLNWHFGD